MRSGMRAMAMAMAVGLGLAACGVGPPPAPTPMSEWAALRDGAPPPAVFALLGARERLGLTSDQVNALDSIAHELSTQNAALDRQLREVWEAPPGGVARPRSRRALEDARPVLARIAENNRGAMDGVHDVLTAPQRALVCRRETAEASRDERRGGAVDPGWSWCRVPETAEGEERQAGT